jgi:hypothetical protein
LGDHHDSLERKDLMTLFAVAKRAAVAGVMTVALAQAADAAVSCAGAARYLATLVRDNWPSSNEARAFSSEVDTGSREENASKQKPRAPFRFHRNGKGSTPAATGGLVSTLLRRSPSGFIPGTTRFTLKAYSQQDFVKQALLLPRPFVPSRQLLRAFDGVQQALVVSDLPGSDLLAANSIGGTASCNSTVFFAVSRGRARPVRLPKDWDNDVGGSCGLTRSFASVQGLPVVIDDDLDTGPSLASTLTLTPWDGGKWQPPCTAGFVFAPHFDTAKTQNDWASLDNWENNDCGSGGCGGFQRAALDLVRQTQQDRTGVEARLLAGLTPAQRQQFQRLKRAADRPDPDDRQTGGDDAAKPSTAATLTDTMPLLLPVVVDDRVFLASVGHFSIGWRVFADWKVTVEAAEAERTREIARFAIGMTPGPIVSVSIR